MGSNEKISVLMVCLGNICRSPMAEAVFRHVAQEHGLLDRFDVIDSAGTGAYHVGSSPDSRSAAECRKNGVSISHRARQVKKEDFERFDYILAMDEENLENLERKKPRSGEVRAKVMMFGEFRGEGDHGGKVVEDPYYGGQRGFEVNFGQCWRFSEGFLRRVLGVDV
ncbi:uncharacterized protein DFL_009474 [Arthrobotrys flagrans]|uniref:Phosphotyrosine protein phosphatase I domain-containing protein n=1 Tax=Arthrobotrys flagrans TaxID=97331 RepID=A0A436ZRS6_ARTFL|nr:hypothetical protein DFL_009474 [Arthrobotrys flagrans]